ncbi:iron chelate uptake ABC transporter family permease subunit [Sneathiella chungangensis]|uniref:Iron chelate uptake ABC transporter family permease subunit n=1 Tax=Sneathiella chungangensis TaxID=1418234 RepID=A0A845MGR5_9PROT|nr:iron ABC transporter permease [Sneathiella chungangensis]MZR22855.1 iron chelate uptake ABC transporter family permease subunit [Sneathiella chungangensis]
MTAASKTIAIPFTRRRMKLPALLLLVLILAAASLVAMSIGAVPIPLGKIISVGLSEQQAAVLSSIRLPRVLLAIVVGAALAVSGAAMQGLFRNPLADPGLIGIATSAALAVAIVIVLAGPVTGYVGLYGMSVAAFIGALASCFAIFRLAKVTGSFSGTYMLLTGIAINALSAAGVGFLTFLSDDQQLRSLTFWTMGSLGGALWISVVVVTSIVVPAGIIMIRNARELNVLLLGENEARYLGVDAERLKRRIVICTALSVGAAISVSGIIGFVGLVVPHLIRLTLGPDHRLLMPASALLGAILLLAADTAARTIVAPAEMPVGVLTSLIGGPFFLWLLVRQYSGRPGL